MWKIVEVTARGFNAENDATDNRVLWIKSSGAQSVKERLDELKVPYLSVVDTDLSPEEANADCLALLPLVAALFGFVVADVRAALESTELTLAQYEHDESMLGQEIDHVLKDVRAAQEVSI